MTPLLLSDRAAAKVLGVSRDTVAALRRAGQLRSVPWLGRFKIPLAEIERLAREGVTAAGRRPRAKRTAPPSAAGAAAAIRAINVEAL